MDSVGTVFLADTLEINDRESPYYYEHFLFREMYKNPENRERVLKYAGSVVIPP